MSDTVITRQLTRAFEGREVVKEVNLRADCQPKRTPVPYSADSTRHN